MKTKHLCRVGGALALLAALAGCSTSSTVATTVLPTAKPSANVPASAGPIGSLIVYTATQEYFDGGQPYYSRTGYEIYNERGEHVRNVRNRLGHTDETPEMVVLPAGKYYIMADSQLYGHVKVPVIIARDRTTAIHVNRRTPNGPREGVPLPAQGSQQFY